MFVNDEFTLLYYLVYLFIIFSCRVFGDAWYVISFKKFVIFSCRLFSCIITMALLLSAFVIVMFSLFSFSFIIFIRYCCHLCSGFCLSFSFICFLHTGVLSLIFSFVPV